MTQEAEAFDATHILLAAGTANFGVTVVAAIAEPLATATEAANGRPAANPVDDAPFMASEPAANAADDTAKQLTGSAAAESAAADSAGSDKVSASKDAAAIVTASQMRTHAAAAPGSLAAEATEAAASDTHSLAVRQATADLSNDLDQQTKMAPVAPTGNEPIARRAVPSAQRMQRSAVGGFNTWLRNPVMYAAQPGASLGVCTCPSRMRPLELYNMSAKWSTLAVVLQVSSWARSSSHATGRRDSAAAIAAAALEAEEPGLAATAAAAAVRAAAQSPLGPAPLSVALPSAAIIGSEADAAAVPTTVAASQAADHAAGQPPTPDPNSLSPTPATAPGAQALLDMPQAVGVPAVGAPASAKVVAALEAAARQLAAPCTVDYDGDKSMAAADTAGIAALAPAASDTVLQTQPSQHQLQQAAAARLAHEQLGAASEHTAPEAAAAAMQQYQHRQHSAAGPHSEQPATGHVHMPVHHASHHRLAVLPTIYESEDAPPGDGPDIGAATEGAE